MLTIAVLGPVTVRRGDVAAPVPSGRTTEVLIRLALDAGTVVRTERLMEDLWPDARGISANVVQSKVSKLRKALGDPGLVVASGAGYLLALDPARVDALDVIRLAGEVRTLLDSGDAAGAAQAAVHALAMFHGDVLPDAGHGEWLVPHRARLEETRLRLLEDQAAAALARGAAAGLVGGLEALVAVHPLREGLWALLITALYRSGRQADALAAYRQVQRVLADELGLDPGPQLRALEQSVLRQDVSLGTARPPDADGPPNPPPNPPVNLPGNLPGVVSTLVGRADDVHALTRLTADHRLVTVTGSAGVGKTRLAIEVAAAARLRGGAWLVRLETARAGEPLWPLLGEAFGLSSATREVVLDRLRAADALLVLDNCEHLAAAVAQVAAAVLSAVPGVRVLATSQLPLGVDGEVVYAVEPLGLADSVALFTQRATQRRSAGPASGRGPDEEREAVEAVCRSLDGLPLAIELAAARTKALSVQDISRRLDDRFALLSDPGGRRPARQRTLGAAISWSYDLLFPDDQRGLWALACFSGGASLPAVEAVLGALDVPVAAAVDVVDRLADRSLVSMEVTAGGAVRYRLLDSVREFSLVRLRQAGSADVAAAAHAAWLAALGERVSAGIRGHDQGRVLPLARAERANIDAALDWCAGADPALGLRIATGFGWSWAVLGGGPGRAQRLRDAASAAGADAVRDQVTALLYASWLEAAGGNVELAATDLDRALAMADDEQRLVGQMYLAFLRTLQGRPRDVLAVLEECRTQLERWGLDWELGAACLLVAWAQAALGDTPAGQAACDEAIRVMGRLGDDWGLIHAEALLGGVAQAHHRFIDATGHLGRAAEAAQRLGFDAAAALHLANLGRAQQQSGDERAAVDTLERAVAAAVAAGDLRMAALARVRLARVLRARGDGDAARSAVTLARDWYRRAGGGDGAGLADYLNAALLSEVAGLDRVLAAARAEGDAEVELLTLDAQAAWHARHGDVSTARSLLALADDLEPAVRHVVTAGDRIDAAAARTLLVPLS